MRDVLDEWRPVVDEQLAALIPREFDDDNLADFFGEPTHEYDRDALQTGIADPIWNLLDRGGKRWRAVLFLLLVDGLGENPHEYLPYAAIPEILHNGTIMVDDVEDEAELRRGEPAIHHVHGADVALNAGNAMYFIPLRIVDRNPADLPAEQRLAAYEMLTYELNRTHLGQGMDIVWHNESEVTTTEAEYLEMCACKTGCLGRIVARLAAIVTGQPESVEEHLADYAEALSVAFQIGDDILDVEYTLDRAGEFGKAFGNDVREGKKTLMALHAVRNAPTERADRLTEILAAPDNTDDEILEAIDILESTGSVAYARERALDLAATARDHVDAVELDPEAADHLKAFTRFVVERDT
jgi:geranylgeranyl diphosphate synthase type I